MHRSSRRVRAVVSLVVLLVSLCPPVGSGFASAATEPERIVLDDALMPLWAEMYAQRATQAGDDGPWVVRAYFSDDHLVRYLASWKEPWEVNRDQGYVIVDVDEMEYARLQAMGFRVVVDDDLTAQFRRPNVLLPGQVSGIPGYPCYRTVEETYSTAQSIVDTYPNLAAWVDVGDSWEKLTPGGSDGYDVMVLQLTNQAKPGPKPKLFVMTSIHPREYAPVELNTRFAEFLVANYGVDADVTWLLDEHEIHLLLVANPDGRKQAEAGLSWRKNTNENYCSPTSNMRGADLNRNFEFQWNCCGGSSSDPCNELYHGPSAASEPETQVVQNYVRSQFPDQREDDLSAMAPVTSTGLFLDVHAYGNLVLWPWGFTHSLPPNSDGLQTLGRKLAYFNGYEPDQAIGLYPTDGTTDDFAYGDLGVAAYTFELGTSFFQSCSVFEDVIVPENMPALLYASKTARTPYLTPAGPEPLDVAVVPGGVAPGAAAQLSAVVDDTRYNNQNGSEPTQNIAAAEYYIDVPPWDAGATAFPMSAADGAFDETVESVTATVDTGGLAEGRHIIYVRGQDVDGNWGVVSAAFLYVIDPATSPVIEGYVRDATNRAPLDAAVTAGAFQAATDPATGYYSMSVVSGAYDVQAIAAGYAISTTDGVVVGDGASVRQDFGLQPLCDIFSDAVESGDAGWTAEGNWAITTEAAHSATHSWTDSPGGNHGNNWNYSLISPVFDLSGYTGVSLSFWHIYDLESGYDYGYLEYSADGGSTWSAVRSYNGENQTTWMQESVALPGADGAQAVQFRFRIDTDSYVTEDGWHIDDVVLRGGGAACAGAPVPPAASFIADDPVMATYPLDFTNLSVGTQPLDFAWDFGDGVGTSTEVDPQYTYAAPGSYTVTLTATNSLGSDVVSRTVEVDPLVCGPLTITTLAATTPVFDGDPVHFDADVTGDAPLTYAWDFGGAGSGDGVDGATPVYVYAAPGTYTVTLEVMDRCAMTETAAVGVLVKSRPDVAWEKDVYVNGVLTGTFPATVIAGDVITVTDRVLITHTENVTFTVRETWSEGLNLLAWSDGGLGTGELAPNRLLWSMGSVTPTTVYTLVKTFEVLPGAWATAALTEELRVEDADPQPPQRMVNFTHLQPDIAVTPDAFVEVLGVGEVATGTLTITNTGEAPLAWDVQKNPFVLWLLATPGRGVVPPMESVAVSVTMIAPPLTGVHTTTLEVVSDDPVMPVVRVPVTLDVRLPYDFAVTPVITAQTGAPGDVVTYTFAVENTGLNADTMTVTVSGASWPVTAPVSVGPVSPNAIAPLPLVVTVPVTASCNAQDPMTLIVTSQNNPLGIETAFLTTLVEAVNEVTITGDGAVRFGDPGAVVSHTARVTNTGNCRDLFWLDATGVWSSTVPVFVGLLSPDEGEWVTVTVTVPEDALAGETDVTSLAATSQSDATVAATTTMTTAANAVYSMTLMPPSQAQSSPQGTVAAYAFELTNAGNATTTFALDVRDTRWSTGLTPTLAVVNPRTSIPVVVTVTVPLTVATMATDTGRITAIGTETAAQSFFTTTAACEPVYEAAFIYTPVSPVGLETVTFTGTVAGGTLPVAYAWDFGVARAIAGGQVVTHMYPLESVVRPYTVTMTATNMCSQGVVQRVIDVRPLEVYLPLVMRD